jgi:hypothetical protein
MRMKWTILAVLGLAAWAGENLPASAEVVPWKAELSGAQEAPPTPSDGKGTLEASYDTQTKQLNWTITFSGLSGPVTAAHLHGPAEPGKIGPIIVPISGPYVSPIKGTATLTSEQADALKRGVYINLHTAQHPEGEIRGELK